MGAKIQMVGKRCGRLTVIYDAGLTENGHYAWGCKCDCGTEVVVRGAQLRNGTTRSCGCLQRDTLRDIRRTHGASRGAGGDLMLAKAYHTRVHVISRCNNPNSKAYPDYGGRGITVCSRWLDSFEAFLSDMGLPPSRQHSIERLDVDGNYDPSNCVWATAVEQARNQRRSRKITINGITKNITTWQRDSGVTYTTIMKRLSRSVPPSLLLKKGKIYCQDLCVS